MLSIVYLLLCVLTGYILVRWFEGLLNKIYEGKSFRLTNWFLALPLSFTLGTLVVTWYTYISCYMFKNTNNAMKYGNILSLVSICFFAFIYYYLLIKAKNIRLKRQYISNNIKLFLSNNKFELWFTLITLFIWSVLINRSLVHYSDLIMPGYSNFSDLGAHLPVIRSFSYGNNFPTEYPHFAQAGMRYHFMFYFLAGNLEYLGLNLASALNLPSIFSITAMCMLLYSLAFILSRSRLVATFSNLFFLLRSSFAFLTFTQGFKSLSSYLKAIVNSLDVNGKAREHIGNTTYESWGLWAQKVFVNQRHLAFVITILIFAIIILLPLLKMTKKLRLSKELLLISLSIGIVLGISVFWNGAVIIAALCILFVMAVFSKNKLSYIIAIGITLILSFLQSSFFIGTDTSPVKPEIYIGFLGTNNISNIPIDIKLAISDFSAYFNTSFKDLLTQLSFNNIMNIIYYITELLGILPFLAFIYLVFTFKTKAIRLALIVTTVAFSAFILFSLPAQLSGVMKVLLWLLLLITCFLLYSCNAFSQKIPLSSKSVIRSLNSDSPDTVYAMPVSRPLLLAFSSPFILAFTLKLTPDITVNHKYIIISCILINIPVACLISQLLTNIKGTVSSLKRSPKEVSEIGSKLYKYKEVFIKYQGYFAKCLAILLIFLLVFTGIVDIFTLHRLDKNHITYNNKDVTTMWVKENTSSDEIFLTDWNTHFGAPMNILLAGRKLFYGYPYFTSTAGYDVKTREKIMKRIYNANDIKEIKDLAIANNITYVVFDKKNLTGKNYPVNKTIFESSFEKVFESTIDNTTIYKIK